MAEGRARSEWDRLSCLMAVIVNSNPYRKGNPVKPAAFNPYAPKAKKAEAVEVDFRTFVKLAYLSPADRAAFEKREAERLSPVAEPRTQ